MILQEYRKKLINKKYILGDRLVSSIINVIDYVESDFDSERVYIKTIYQELHDLDFQCKEVLFIKEFGNDVAELVDDVTIRYYSQNLARLMAMVVDLEDNTISTVEYQVNAFEELYSNIMETEEDLEEFEEGEDEYEAESPQELHYNQIMIKHIKLQEKYIKLIETK